MLRSGVTLRLGDNAVLQQISDESAYVKPASPSPDCCDYIPYTPKKRHNFFLEIKWDNNWFHNDPFIYAPRGSHGFAIRGKGIIRMMDSTSDDDCIKLCPIGFSHCRDFVIEGVHITNYHGFAIMPSSLPSSGSLYFSWTPGFFALSSL